MSQLGRIGGQVLSDNLLRAGIDLAFETDLLYLRVSPAVTSSTPNEDGDINPLSGANAIGINTSAPTHTLHVNGTTQTTNLIVDGTSAKIDNVIINTNGSFTTLVGPLNIVPTGSSAFIEHERLVTDGLMLNDNILSGTVVNQAIELRPNGTGDVSIDATTNIFGSINVTQNILANSNVRLEGILTIGDTSFDTLTVTPDFTQSIIPGDNELYDLGTSLKRWRTIYAADNIQNPNFTADTINVSDQLRFTTNQITSLQSNDDIVLSSSEGTVTFNSISVKDNTITNLLSTPLIFSHTGNGYLQFAGTFGFQIPAGTTAERQANAVGDTRWNTELSYLECWDGTVWEVATGGGETVTSVFMEDLGHQYTLIFG